MTTDCPGLAQTQGSEPSPLSLFPKTMLGIFFGAVVAVPTIRVFDPPEVMAAVLLVLPCLGAVLGAAVAARQIRLHRSPDELVRLKRASFRWSLIMLLLGPAVGIAWALVLLQGRWHFVSVTKCVLIGALVGLVMSISMAVAGTLLGWPAKETQRGATGGEANRGVPNGQFPWEI